MTQRDYIESVTQKLAQDAGEHTRVYSTDAMQIVKILMAVLDEHDKGTLSEFLASEPK
jgi:hypothetical protein